MSRRTKHISHSTKSHPQRKSTTTVRLFKLRSRSGTARLGPGQGFRSAKVSHMSRGTYYLASSPPDIIIYLFRSSWVRSWKSSWVWSRRSTWTPAHQRLRLIRAGTWPPRKRSSKSYNYFCVNLLDNNIMWLKVLGECCDSAWNEWLSCRVPVLCIALIRLARVCSSHFSGQCRLKV